MKAILEFDLPEEQEEYKMANKGSDYFHALWDIDQEIFRKRVKYDDTLSDKEYKLVEKMREEFLRG